jgi:hypothetical protein
MANGVKDVAAKGIRQAQVDAVAADALEPAAHRVTGHQPHYTLGPFLEPDAGELAGGWPIDGSIQRKCGYRRTVRTEGRGQRKHGTSQDRDISHVNLGSMIGLEAREVVNEPGGNREKRRENGTERPGRRRRLPGFSD